MEEEKGCTQLLQTTSCFPMFVPSFKQSNSFPCINFEVGFNVVYPPSLKSNAIEHTASRVTIRFRGIGSKSWGSMPIGIIDDTLTLSPHTLRAKS